MSSLKLINSENVHSQLRKNMNELMAPLPSFHPIKSQIYFEYELSTHHIHIFQHFSLRESFSTKVDIWLFVVKLYFPQPSYSKGD